MKLFDALREAQTKQGNLEGLEEVFFNAEPEIESISVGPAIDWSHFDDLPQEMLLQVLSFFGFYDDGIDLLRHLTSDTR